MAIPASGTITMGDLQTYLDGVTPGANAASISEYYAGGAFVTVDSFGYPGGVRTAIPASGQISLTNFYGAKWLGGITYEYVTPGTYTVTLPARTGFVKNYRYSGIIQGGGGGGGGAHGSTAPNTDVINSGGGGGGGARVNFDAVNSTDSSLTFTIVVGAGGAAGTNSTAANPYTPGGTAGGAGGSSRVTINGVVLYTAVGGGGGGGGALNNGSLGTSGAAGAHYGGGFGSAPGYASNDYWAAGGRGGDTIFGYGSFGYNLNGSSTIPGGRGAGGAGGGGEGGDLRNTPSAGGSGYARISFRNQHTYTTSVTYTSATTGTSWTVPAGIYQIQANVMGAGGGGSYSAAGGYMIVLINVTPGEVLTVRVGGTGTESGWNNATLTVTGGINGGGGGDKANTASGVAGGGGYSGIFRSSTALVIAGGGGGYASDDATAPGSDYGGSNIYGGAPGGSPDFVPRKSGFGANTITSNSGASLQGTTGVGGKGVAGGGGGGYLGGGAYVDASGVVGAYYGGGGGSSYKSPGVAEIYKLPGYGSGGSWLTSGGTGQAGSVTIYY